MLKYGFIARPMTMGCYCRAPRLPSGETCYSRDHNAANYYCRRRSDDSQLQQILLHRVPPFERVLQYARPKMETRTKPYKLHFFSSAFARRKTAQASQSPSCRLYTRWPAPQDKRLMRRHWPFAILAALALALLITNLGSGYFWEDEGDTAVLASNILKFGVPKAWDGVTFTESDKGAR